eukprot:gene27748-34515_t
MGCASSVFGNSTSSGGVSTSLLISAPSGTGATTLVQTLAKMYGAALMILNSARVRARRGEAYSADTLFETLQCALVQAPVVILLDDLQYLVPRKDTGGHRHAVEYDPQVDKVVSSLLDVIHTSSSPSSSNKGGARNNKSPPRILLVGIVHSEASIDRVLADKFKTKLTIPLPTGKERLLISEEVHRECARRCREERVKLGEDDIDITVPTLSLLSLCDTLTGRGSVDFKVALEQKVTDAINKRYNEHKADRANNTNNNTSNTANKPTSDSTDIMTNFSSVCGHALIKQKLVEVILWPRLYSELYRDFGVTAGDVGILLYGPPGTGKTLLPRVLSSHLKINLLNMKLSDVVRGEVGSSEKAVVGVFSEAKRTAPCIVFVDEFQALFTRRQGGADREDQTGTSLSSTLAICFDDLRLWNQVNPTSLVTVIAASNEPWCIDNTFLRSGRMSVCLYVGALDADGRTEFLQQRLSEMLRTVKVDKKSVEFRVDIREMDDEVVNNSSNNNNGQLTPLTPTQIAHYTQEIHSFSQLKWLTTVVDLTEGFTGADMALLVSRTLIEMNKGGGGSEVIAAVEESEKVTKTDASEAITPPVATTATTATHHFDAPFVPYAKNSTHLTTPFVRISIQEVVKTLVEAVVLVFVVMYLFLQNFRATLIPTIAVPVVLLGTFGVLAAFGYSLNTLTMLAMVLAIGLLVDAHRGEMVVDFCAGAG